MYIFRNKKRKKKELKETKKKTIIKNIKYLILGTRAHIHTHKILKKSKQE